MSQSCRCRVSVNPHAQGKPYAIVYCPLHAAAPELVEAVKAVQQGFRDGTIRWWDRPRQADSEPYHHANTLMCAAMAKAEGRG